MLQRVPSVVGRAMRHVRPGIEKLSYFSPALAQAPELIQVSSPSFDAQGMLPARCTKDGRGLSPALSWQGVAIDTAALALLVEDADSPTPQPLVHAIVYGLNPYDAELKEGAIAADVADEQWILGRNSLLGPGWLPPDPPPGHGPHRYAFQLYALDQTLLLTMRPGRGELLQEMQGHVIAKGCLLGIYERD
jgi:Raf kinase inhibitor-like YbhB/YbcL family protein